MATDDLNTQQLVEEHQRLKKRLSVLRIVFPLVAVGIIVGYLFMIAKDVQGMDTDALATHLEKESHRLAPRVQEHLGDLASKLEPVYAKELARQSKALAPKLDGLIAKETEVLKQNVTKHFETELDKALSETELRQRGILVQYIPELKGNKAAQDRVLASVRTSLLKWSMRQLTHTFNEHVIAMERIRKTLQSGFRTKPGEKAKARPDDVLMLWLDLMSETVGGDDNILGGSQEPATRGKKKAKRRK